MRHLILASIILTLLGCTEDNSNPIDKSRLKGNWVGVEDDTDTLSFEPVFEDKEIINLKRAVLLRSGPYEYELLPNDKISIHWMLAATMTFHEYHFKVRGDQLTIGNFYDSPAGPILTFKKID